MGLAEEKTAFLLANGNPITIIRPSGNIPTTGRIMAIKRRTDMYSINYLREAIFVADSVVQRGDWIRDEATGEQYFVEALQVKTKGGSVLSIDAELYMINYPSIPIQRLQKTYDDSGNLIGSSWQTIATLPGNVQHVNGKTEYRDGLLLPDAVFKITTQTDKGLIAGDAGMLPTSFSVQLNDRLILDEKPYRVIDIDLSTMPGLQVIQVAVDSR